MKSTDLVVHAVRQFADHLSRKALIPSAVFSSIRFCTMASQASEKAAALGVAMACAVRFAHARDDHHAGGGVGGDAGKFALLVCKEGFRQSIELLGAVEHDFLATLRRPLREAHRVHALPP